MSYFVYKISNHYYHYIFKLSIAFKNVLQNFNKITEIFLFFLIESIKKIFKRKYIQNIIFTFINDMNLNYIVITLENF